MIKVTLEFGTTEELVKYFSTPQIIPATTLPEPAASEHQPAAAAAVDAPAGAGESRPSASMDDVRATAQKVIEKLGNERGMEAARKVLMKKAGVKVLRDIPAEKLDGVLEGLKALL